MQTLLDRLGMAEATYIAVKTTPIWAIPALPITIIPFFYVLSKSTDIERFQEHHIREKNQNWIYDIFRPRGRDVIPLLREHYGIR